ncbi:MAG: phasin family protein [Hyphomonadaceae bacterium]
MAATKTAARAEKVAQGARNAFEQVTTASSEAFRDNVDRATAAAAEMTAFSKQNVEAFIASATATQKGVEAISARAAAYSKSALENHMAAAKNLMTSKSVQEFVEKQSAYARSSFDAYVAELTSLSDVWQNVAKDAIKPLNERMSAMSHLMQSGAVR